MKKLLFDAGHGGPDPGVVVEGIAEKDINLAVVLEMFKITERRMPDFEPWLTRGRDIAKSRTSRYEAIVDLKPDAFISVHCNAIEDYPYTKVDEREIVQGTEIYYRDTYDFPLAEAINHLFCKSDLWTVNRGVKSDVEHLGKRLTVLNSLKIPSVLIEIGYLTHPYERKMIMSNVYNIADLIMHGVGEYFRSFENGKL